MKRINSKGKIQGEIQKGKKCGSKIRYFHSAMVPFIHFKQ